MEVKIYFEETFNCLLHVYINLSSSCPRHTGRHLGHLLVPCISFGVIYLITCNNIQEPLITHDLPARPPIHSRQ